MGVQGLCGRRRAPENATRPERSLLPKEGPSLRGVVGWQAARCVDSAVGTVREPFAAESEAMRVCVCTHGTYS